MKYYSVVCLRWVRYLAVCVLSALLLSACGGGGGSSSSSGTGSGDSAVTPPPPKAVSGTAVKGVIANADVTAHAIQFGVISELLASTNTDASGNYSLMIPGEYEGPVLITISARNDGSSLMTCDGAGGCGDFTGLSEHDSNINGSIDFGEQYNLPNDFSLRALVPARQVGQLANVDVTLLTHLAAAYAETFPQGFDNLSAELAITQIANLFDLDANLFELNTPDLTNNEDFSRASESEKLYALLTSSIANLVNSDELSESMETLANSFALNNGQLVIRSDDDNELTLAKLLQAGLSNLSLVQSTTDNESLTTFAESVQAKLSETLTSDAGTLTSAEGSPTSGSDELEKINQFISDLQQWQQTISVTSGQQPLVSSGYDLATGSNAFHGPLLQAIALSSQHAAIVAVPDLALEAACNSLTNLFARVLCQSLIAKNSIENICNAALNLSFFGVSLCDFLNNLTLPLGHGLWANYEIYDGNARIFGELEGVAVDLTFTGALRSGDRIQFNVVGEFADGVTEGTITAGTVSFHFADTLTSETLQMPERVTLRIQQDSATFTDSETLIFSGTTVAEVDITEVTGAGQTGSAGVRYNVTNTGDFEYGQSGINEAFSGTITASNQRVTASYAIQNQTMTTAATLSLTDAESFELSWNGRQYGFTLGSSDNEITEISITNQDSIQLNIDLTAPNDTEAGALTIGGADYAEVTWLNDSLWFRLPDNSEALLY